MQNPLPLEPSTAPDLRSLRLERAHALLGRSEGARQFSAVDANPAAYLQSLIDDLCDLSVQDALTGLSNRRQFCAVLERELDRVSRSGEATLLLMLDIDHFKRINDTHGHGVGDKVLQAVARTLSQCVRPMDSLARYGGEEFAMVLPSCPGSFAHVVADRIRSAVENTVVHLDTGAALSVTISIGGAFALQWVRSTPSLWLERADQQLYRAKSEGRNRVCIEPRPDSTVSAEEKGLLFGALQTFSEWDSLAHPDPAACDGASPKAMK